MVIFHSYVSSPEGIKTDYLDSIHEKGLLVGDEPTPLETYEFVSWDDDIPNI